jgi:uncharacterized protein YqjF (DUF2071 family)
MRQRWHDLLFAHWSFPAEAIARLLPAGLTLDTFDGRAWVGVVPFRMSGVRPFLLPSLPGAGAFPELNVRTYVTCGGEPGVWFFSLDATSRLAVRAARRWFHLPYFDAAMRCRREGDRVDYESLRIHDGAPWAALRCTWRAGEPCAESQPGSLEFFLTERYFLYSAAGSRLYRGRIRHRPWPLRQAELRAWQSSMLGPLGLAEPREPPHLRCADRLDVTIHRLERLNA